MNAKNKNLALRIISAAVALPGLFWLLSKGGVWSAGLMAFAAAVCTAEYFLITLKRLSLISWAGIAVATLLPLFPVWNLVQGTAIAFWTVSVYFFAAWAFYLFRAPAAEAPNQVGHLLTGVLYGGIGFHAFSTLRLGGNGYEWVMCALIITWGNDTSAYFAGRFLGRHKLYPEVSPNKTWEGFAGGMFGSVVGMFIARATFFADLKIIDCLALGVLGGVLGPLGDLCESMLKRAYHVKDSGKLIPGHGGMLDRVDALLFNGPMVFLYVYFLK